MRNKQLLPYACTRQFTLLHDMLCTGVLNGGAVMCEMLRNTVLILAVSDFPAYKQCTRLSPRHSTLLAWRPVETRCGPCPWEIKTAGRFPIVTVLMKSSATG